MINLVPINRMVAWIAVGYAVATLLGLTIMQVSTLSLRYALVGSSALYFILVATTSFGWKYVWRLIPSLNHWLFPLIEGKWDMTIHWQGVDASGVVQAEATIKQNFFRISMEVSSNGSDSETLIAQPKKDPESGTPLLYYVYRVTPKLKNGESGADYKGAAILKFSPSEALMALKGNYFTSAKTTGYFELVKRLPTPSCSDARAS